MSKTPNITYLPQVKIRYNGSTPSMSKRGGVRLNPITDGVINMQASSQQIRTRDGHGQKLRDVSNPMTGMYSHSVSALESAPNYEVGMDKPAHEPISGAPTGTLKYLPAKTVNASTGEKVYLDENGRRIRTTSMGEEPIGAVPAGVTPDVGTKPTRKSRTVDARAPRGASPRRTPTPASAPVAPRITDDMIRDYIRATARSKNMPEPTVFPLAMMQAGREALKLARVRMAKAIAKNTGQ